MRFVSLFSGIEAASTAWEPLGFKALAFAEIEPFPSAVLAHHWPQVPNLGSVLNITQESLDALGQIDLVVGGSPCQSFSVAGLCKGLEDGRGNLALRYVELVEASKARFLLWENVPGVLSDKTNAFGCILGALAGEDAPLITPGGKWPHAGVVVGPKRALVWRVLDARHFGVPQRRARVFLLGGHPGDAARLAEVLLEQPRLQRHPSESRKPRKEAPGGVGEGVEGGGEVIPLLASGACNANNAGIYEGGGPTPTIDTTGSVAVAFKPSPFTRGKDGGDEACQRTIDAFKKAQEPIPFDPTQLTHPENRSRPMPGDPSPTLAKGAHPPAVCFNVGEMGALRRGNIASSPPGLGVDTYNQTVEEAVVRSSAGEGVPATISLNSNQHLIVRRLTPRECERLQGFPDDATLIPFKGKPAADGNRYKALGNSMAVVVMRWIGRRLQLQFPEVNQ